LLKLKTLWRAILVVALASSLAATTSGCAPEPDLPPNVFIWTFPQQPGEGDVQTHNICAHFTETGSCKNAKIPPERWVKVDSKTRFDPADAVTLEEYAAGWILHQWRQGTYKPIVGEELLLQELDKVNEPGFQARWLAYAEANAGIKPTSSN
jgi:hypothetical protein